MVGRYQVLDVAGRCAEEPFLCVVRPVGQKLQREERVRRSALAQVDLDRIWRPIAGYFAHDEVDRESAEHTLTGQPLPDDRSLAGGRGRAPVAALLI